MTALVVAALVFAWIIASFSVAVRVLWGREPVFTPTSCPECGRSAWTRGEIDAHMAGHHPTGFMFTCTDGHDPVFVTFTREEMNAHLDAHFREDYPE